VLEDEATFDALDAAFEAIARGKQRIKVDDFVAHFWSAARKGLDSAEIRSVFDLADSDGDGTISKLELLGAVKQHPQVAALALPWFDASRVMKDQDAFDAVHRVFDAVAAGKRRIGFADFQSYFQKVHAGQVAPECDTAGGSRDRSETRVFLLDPAGLYRHPVAQAGFSVHWCAGLPNLQPWVAPAAQQFHAIQAEMDAAQPHVLACAPQAANCVYALWQAGIWRGPTVLINPQTVCRRIPTGVPVVLIHVAVM
jgi:Ca2+-binding EF-hand superfamily protein